MSNDVVPWKPSEPVKLPPEAKAPAQIVTHAHLLKAPEQRKLLKAYESGLYEIATEYLWKRAMSALKVSLASLGMKFVGEMLGRHDITNTSVPDNVLTDWDAISLAEQLGALTPTGALRLRHYFELLSHLARVKDDETLEENEAVGILRSCVSYILSREGELPGLDFAKFRDRILSSVLQADDPQVKALRTSPLFFAQTTLRVLVAAARSEAGARLQYALANLSVILPNTWENLPDDDRWTVGTTFAELTSAGSPASQGIRQALVKVSGFDYVPENLRSESFREAAKAVLVAHHSYNNYHLEEAPVQLLASLGTVIPKPAFIECFRAYLAVYLGNKWGNSRRAAPVAREQLMAVSRDLWLYYLDKILLTDREILPKISDALPRKNLVEILRAAKIARDPSRASGNRIVEFAEANDADSLKAACQDAWWRLMGVAEESEDFI